MNFSEFNKTIRVCALFSLSIILWIMITNGSIQIYLHPRTLPLIKISFFILLALTFYNIRIAASQTFDKSINWKFCILFFPIALGISVNPAGLSSRIAMQKGLASAAMNFQSTVNSSVNHDSLSELTTASANEIRSQNNMSKIIIPDSFIIYLKSNSNIIFKKNAIPADTPIQLNKSDTISITSANDSVTLHSTNAISEHETLQDDSLEIKLDRIYLNPQKNAGKRITMTGFIAPDTLLGSNSFFIARMLITCCAADAMPVGFYCIPDTAFEIHEGDWVTISGIIEPRQIQLPWEENMKTLPVLKVTRVEATKPPQRQYIYPTVY